ncbi:sodium-dependent glucose transporter 1B-like isoform X2 [Physella acuta]|uniref:sodium-dependent glucose transporter 1B-like isoform X2 n=1 Tax=Physella acuta TaxID=109671 RepID=UPI0027DD482F|nr:sodium-dependent glucose transporter 1B-like isoform X2 [Physella acuta]
MGIIIGQQGPSFLDLQIITGTDVETASSFFTAASFGYMVGSFISGFVHGKVRNNVVMVIVNAGAGIMAIITPHCSPFVLMLMSRFSTNMFCGGIDTFVNAEHIRIWGSDGQPLLQFIHFTFALGGVLTPLFTEPFLAEKETGNSTSRTDGEPTIFMNSTSQWKQENTSNMTWLATNGTMLVKARTTNVYYAFLIAGIIAILTSFPFIYLSIVEKQTEHKSEEKYTQKVHSRKLPRHLNIFVILVLCFFYLVYCCVEDTFASFLMTFVVTEYDEVSKSKGAYITTFYWASFAVGRFLSIFVSKYVIAVKLISLYTILMVIAYSGFTISALFSQIDAITVFAGMAGISMSAVFPAGFSWTESELLKVTGWVSSFILIASSIGMMINPLIIGYLMEEVSNMWFCYVLLSQTLLLCCIFLFLLLFNRCYLNKVYGKVGDSKNVEKVVETPLEETEKFLENDLKTSEILQNIDSSS